MIVGNQNLGQTEMPATHWLRTLLLTTICGKMYEGWKIISSDKNYIRKIVAHLLKSDDKFKKEHETLNSDLKKGSFIEKIRHNIGFHYQLKDFDQWPPHAQDGDQLLSVLFTEYDGDMLPSLPVVPLFETVARLHRSSNNPEPNTYEEWEKSHLSSLNEVSKTSNCYCVYLQKIFLTMLKEIVQDDCNISYEKVENPPAYNAQQIYFFMTPPSNETYDQLKKELNPDKG